MCFYFVDFEVSLYKAEIFILKYLLHTRFSIFVFRYDAKMKETCSYACPLHVGKIILFHEHAHCLFTVWRGVIQNITTSSVLVVVYSTLHCYKKSESI